jgi:hypothetical protein
MPKTLTAPNGLTTTLDYHPANSISQTICVILFLNLGLTVVGRVGEQEIFMCLGGF